MSESFYERFVETKAVEVFGMEHQIRKFHEEIGEALQAMNKYLNGEDTLEHMAEELADLSVTLDEMVIGFDIAHRVSFYRDRKLDRLWAKILKREGAILDGEETENDG